MDTIWQINLLGGLQLRRGTMALKRFRTQKVAALLARLAFYPHRAHLREELADFLWPEADFDAARANLRQALLSLRRQLEPPGVLPGTVLEADRTHVRLNPAAVQTDVAAFEAALRAAGRAATNEDRLACLTEALGCYQDELLPGLYDEWVIAERERLKQAYKRAQAQRDALAACLPAANSAAAQAPESAPILLSAPSAAATAPTASQPRLPIQFTLFFGREEETACVADWLHRPGTRLLTLTGPGGAGKTRLAVEAARHVAADFGTVCFVSLASLSDPSLVPAAIADALGLPRAAREEPQDQVVAALRDGHPALLVLDNLEQFAEAAAPLALSLLSRVPTLRLLATSRQRLFVAGERELAVAPLPLPAPADAPDPAALLAFPSVALFADRAQALSP